MLFISNLLLSRLLSEKLKETEKTFFSLLYVGMEHGLLLRQIIYITCVWKQNAQERILT
jgi:hypothetical protein